MVQHRSVARGLQWFARPLNGTSFAATSLSSQALHPVAWAVLCLSASWAQAQNAVPAAGAADAMVIAQGPALKEVVVSGSRQEQDPDELPLTIDVLGTQQMEQAQMRDIRDVARELPNVSVRRAPARFDLALSSVGREQNAGFNIRGLEGNRVLMMVDGMRLPRSYGFGATSFGRDALELGLIQRVEIVRGASSALYGSDGMGGLVHFITASPDNFLKEGKTLGGRFSLGMDSDDVGRTAGAVIAGQPNDTVQWMVGASIGRAHALSNEAENAQENSNRTRPNPERGKSAGLLAKVVITPGQGQRHSFTLEHVDKHTDYELLTARTPVPTAATHTLRSFSFMDMERTRGTWVGEWKPRNVLVDDLRASLGWQQSKSRDYIYQQRVSAGDRVRDTHYDESAWQANVQGIKQLRMDGGWVQKITYGLEHVSGTVKNLQDGLMPPAGEVFPLKRFPDTRETSTALYLQNAIEWGQWTITPGVRFDHFSIKASPEGFVADAASLSGNATSPKLGVMFRATPEWSLYGNYAAGFRAPSAGQINGFFENPDPSYGYKTIPNPNLKPEKSQNVELGVRGRVGAVRLDAAVFSGRYKDFIESNVTVGKASDGRTMYQSVNRNRVRLSGFEAKGQVDWGKWAGGHWSSHVAYGQTQGKDRDSGAPLESIDPSSLSMGLRYDTAAWNAQLHINHTTAKKAGDVATANAFLPPSATTLDLTGQWRIRPDLRLTAGLYNLTDKKHWRWADVRSLSANSTTLDAYTQSGRTVRVSLVADF